VLASIRSRRGAARPRLAEIITNLTDRIQEAKINGWLGEVQSLEVSLKAATAKLISLDRLRERKTSKGDDPGHPSGPQSVDPAGVLGRHAVG
jgi:hypothetical protein